MQYALTLLALGASAAVAEHIKDSGPTPGGCQTTYSGTFGFQPVKLPGSSKRDLTAMELVEREEKRAQSCGTLPITLNDGIMISGGNGFTGYVASNSQFQFDGPPQSKAIFTDQFSICANGSIAIGSNTLFYNCASGSFANIYFFHGASDVQDNGGQSDLKTIPAQCTPVNLETYPCQPTGTVITTARNALFPTDAPSGSGSVASSSAADSSSSAVSSAVATSAATSAAVIATPYPAGNSTMAVATAATVATSATSTSGATTAPASPAASTFHGAGNMLAVSQSFVAVVAFVGAVFML